MISSVLGKKYKKNAFYFKHFTFTSVEMQHVKVKSLLFYFYSPLLFYHQSSIATIETKFRQADEELLQLRSNLKHYEGLVDEYKSQVGTGNRK